VLVRELLEKENPEKVCFETVPIWAQFTGIPFYLLSKQLARRLGRRLGGFICIDNNTRGDLDNKILHARVHHPVAQALQRWITLEDEFSEDEVIVTVLYERLPNYCVFCGFIGHQEGTCDLPPAIGQRRYTQSIGV
jgi:hypothetical protein